MKQEIAEQPSSTSAEPVKLEQTEGGTSQISKPLGDVGDKPAEGAPKPDDAVTPTTIEGMEATPTNGPEIKKESETEKTDLPTEQPASQPADQPTTPADDSGVKTE